MFKKFFACLLVTAFATVGLSATAQAQALRIGIGDPLDSGAGQYGVKFKELVEAKTNGEYTIDLFPSGALGDEAEMLQNTRRGSLDMCIVGIGNAVPMVPTLAALTFPYLLDTEEAVVKATTGKLFDYFNEQTIKTGGFRILGYVYTNYRFLTNSKRPVKNLNDVKGLKVRVPNNEVFIATYKAWGANPVPMGWNETFTALQQGVVDGQDNPYVVNYTMKFQEVQDYITEVHYQYSLQPLFIGEKKFESFSPEVQKIFKEAAMEAQMYILNWENENSSVAKKGMRDAGVEVAMLEDEAAWRQKAIDEVWPTMYEFVGGKEVIDMILTELKN